MSDREVALIPKHTEEQKLEKVYKKRGSNIVMLCCVPNKPLLTLSSREQMG